MENNKEKKLKITKKYFPRAWKEAVFPEIRLAGKWLQEAGFNCGQFVTITQQGNSITITALPEVQVQPPMRETKHKKENELSPELQSVTGFELFNLKAEEYREWIEKEKALKRRRKKIATERFWENYKKGLEANYKKQEEAREKNNNKGQVIQINPETNQVADNPNPNK